MTYDIPIRTEYIAGWRKLPVKSPTSPERGILTLLMEERRQFLENVISGLKEQILERERLNARLHATLTDEWLAAKGKIYELDIWPIGQVRSIDQRRQTIEKELAALEAERRKEDVVLFQDITLLRRDLREWEQKYQDAMRRVKIILNNQG